MSSLPNPGPENNNKNRAESRPGQYNSNAELNTSSNLGPAKTALKKLFYGEVENTFHVRLGVTDTQVINYISDMLVKFVRTDSMFTVRTVRGQQIYDVTSMLAEANQRLGPERAKAYNRLGDFTLFMTGFLPEAVDFYRKQHSKDALIDYQQQGKRAYWIASQETIPNVDPAVLKGLSQNFDLYSFGLGEVRQSIESDQFPGDTRLIRLLGKLS